MIGTQNMLAIVVATAAANFITGEYSVNQWLCCKNIRHSYFNQDTMLLKTYDFPDESSTYITLVYLPNIEFKLTILWLRK